MVGNAINTVNKIDSVSIVNIFKSEFLLTKRNTLVNWILFTAIVALYPIFIEDANPILIMSCILISMLPATVLAKQSKFKAESMYCALPITRSQLIRGKYLYSGIVAIAGFLYLFILLFVLPYTQFTKNDLFSLDKLVNMVFAVSIVQSLLIPLIIAFGFMGIMILILGLNILTVVIFILTAARLISNALRFVFESIPQAFLNLRESIGAPGYHLLMLGVAIGLWYLSLKISQRIYERKEL